MPTRMVEVEGDVIGESDDAWHFSADGGDSAVWLPKSLCEWSPKKRHKDDSFGTMEIPEWLADKEGLT